MPYRPKPALVFLALMLAGAPAAAQTRVGLAVPGDDTAPLLEAQMRAGAERAADDLDAELVIEADTCSADGGGAAARRFVEDEVDACLLYTSDAADE